ncbi:MAG: 50S ribosomal protein L30 [Dehalococcoidia bacterium]|nr:50S ribosomal protein L30 [Dehalococcoidia bacterium]|tara:strand:+ start:208 stop:390 length:183 start_codon:yes stop_codon:yes gene_type:complete
MSNIMIVQTKSYIGSNKKQRDTLKALGLGKIGDSVVKENSKVILGMVSKVSHLLKIENIK